MTVRQRPLRPALFFLLLIALGIGLLAQWVIAADVDVLPLLSYFHWEPGPTVHACPVDP
ncbi:MAG: hypothetical protein GY888_15490 [Planctomycetaceae bacterium]|nr:hypothetical protein [Planctomycetaceae bacterium]